MTLHISYNYTQMTLCTLIRFDVGDTCLIVGTQVDLRENTSVEDKLAKHRMTYSDCKKCNDPS